MSKRHDIPESMVALPYACNEAVCEGPKPNYDECWSHWKDASRGFWVVSVAPDGTAYTWFDG